MDRLAVPAEMQVALVRTVEEVFHRPGRSEKLLKADLADRAGSVLFRVTRMTHTLESGPAALIVSNYFHWRKTIDTLLNGVFKLTVAEQNVVRLLVEGHDTKSIAAVRKTSEGTVRGQIKSILSKMNLRSQTDIVRVVMTLGEFPAGTEGRTETVELAAPTISNDWIEAEVWKPFSSIKVPDGRTLTYHDMGPKSGNPALFSHMGSCMARWSHSMIRLAFEHNLRVICPIRGGYGYSDDLKASADPLGTASGDTLFLLESLGIARLPYVVQGTDFPFASDLIAKHPDVVSDLIGIGARPCLPGGQSMEEVGRWQRFFVSTARHAPHLVQFASNAVMAMCKQIGPEAMLRQLCRDPPSDLALLEVDEMKQVLVANISLMAGKSTNAARAFAREYIAFQKDWSSQVMATRHVPVQIFLAKEDPTIDFSALPKLATIYPWIKFDVMGQAGLALMFQKYKELVPVIAKAAARAGGRGRSSEEA